MNTEPVHEVDDVGGESDADGHIADRIFENQVPADDPGNEFAHGGVGVGVGAASDGDHGGELGVANRSEAADNRDENEREGNGRASAGAAKRFRVIDQIFEQGRVEDRGGFEFLAGDGGADDGENAG